MTLHTIQNISRDKHRAVIYEAATMLLESDLALPKKYRISCNTKRELKRIIWGIGENKALWSAQSFIVELGLWI